MYSLQRRSFRLCHAEDDAIVVNGDEVKLLWRPVESDDGGTAEAKTMSSDLNNSGDGTETVEQKLDTLSTSVDRRFDTVGTRFDALSASVDTRFDALDLALIEQRQYTEFAFDRLDGRFDRSDNRFDKFDSRFDRLERKLDQVHRHAIHGQHARGAPSDGAGAAVHSGIVQQTVRDQPCHPGHAYWSE